MNTKQIFTILAVISLFSVDSAIAQYGYGSPYGGYGGYGGGGYYGGRRSGIPQVQTPQKEEKPKTAEEIVELQMPSIIEAIELNAFEEAIVRTILTKSIQRSIELSILKLEPEKTKEEYEKIRKAMDEEMKASLPNDKYLAFKELQENQFNAQKANRKKKKEKKKRKKSKE